MAPEKIEVGDNDISECSRLSKEYERATEVDAE